MPYEHRSKHIIQFSETDMAGLVHFSNFFKYMELAERDFFAANKLDLIKVQPRELTGWPRARAECKFTAPLRFGDTIEIHLAVKAVKDRAIDYQFRIYRCNADKTVTQAGKGHMTTILAKLNENGSLQSIELPTEVCERIVEAPMEILQRPDGV